MAKYKKQYGLKGGHPTAFRRTVDIGTEKNPNRVTLLFEPGKPLELTAIELEGLKAELAEGFIVPWEEHGQGMRPVASPTQTAELDALKAKIEELTAQNAELLQAAEKVPAAALKAEIKTLKAQNAELLKQLEDATAPAAIDDDGTTDPNAPLGDE